MKRKTREEDFFGFPPTSIVNDFSQAVSDYINDQMGAVDKFLKKAELNANEKKDIKKVHINVCYCDNLFGKKKKGTDKLGNILQNSFDKQLDSFEIEVKTIFQVPENVDELISATSSEKNSRQTEMDEKRLDEQLEEIKNLVKSVINKATSFLSITNLPFGKKKIEKPRTGKHCQTT